MTIPSPNPLRKALADLIKRAEAALDDAGSMEADTWQALLNSKERARSALAADDAAGGWRDISTAPANGHMLGYSWKWGVSEVMRGDDGLFMLATFNGAIKEAHPTHWQPLPPSPAGADEKEEWPGEPEDRNKAQNP